MAAIVDGFTVPAEGQWVVEECRVVCPTKKGEDRKSNGQSGGGGNQTLQRPAAPEVM